MPAPKRPSAAQLQKQCDKWNAANEVGTTVVYEETRGEGETFRGKSKSEAQVLGGHSAVIWLEGKSGCVALDHCIALAAEAVPVIRLELEDRGQDFTEWYVRDGIVIDCQPNQGRVWVGTKVINQAEIEPGSIIEVVSKATGAATRLNYAAVSVIKLSPEAGAEVEGYGRKWAEIMGVARSELGL